MSALMNYLPDAVLLRIFSILAYERLYNLFRLRLVCQRWKTLAADCSLWRRISFPNNNYFDIETFKRLVSWCNSIKEVDISSCSMVDDSWLDVVAENCCKLEILRARNCSLTDGSLRRLSSLCPNLRVLTISYQDEENISSKALSEIMEKCPRIEEIQVFYEDEEQNTEQSFPLAASMVQKLMNCRLKQFYFEGASFSSETIFRGNISDIFNQSLVEIGLPKCMDLTNHVLVTIANKCPCLRSLDISHCPGINDVGLVAVAELCPSLETVNVMACQSVTDIAIESLAKYCKSLYSLCVAGSELPRPMGNITDVAIESVATQCPNLHELDVKWCQGVTDVGISAIATNCLSLSHLNVSGCLAISDISMLIIAAYAKNLEKLEITECLRITSISVNAVAQNCSKLRRLDMEVCSYLTEMDFRSDISVFLPLQHIDLSYCTKVTDHCIKCITCVCHTLAFISLAGCRRITDAGIKYIGQNCPLLQYVDISFRGSQSNIHLSTDSLVTLANRCHFLIYVDVIGCWNLTLECVKTFIEFCKYLSQLSISLLSELETSHDQKEQLLNLVACHRFSCSVNKVSRSTRSGKLAESFIINMSARVL